MKPTNYRASLGFGGRICVPRSIRKELNLQEGDTGEFTLRNDNIIELSFKPRCDFCKTTDNVVRFEDICVCDNCINKISRTMEKTE